MTIGNALIQLVIALFFGICFAIAGLGLDFFLITKFSFYTPFPLFILFYPLGVVCGVVMMSRRHSESGSITLSILGAFGLLFSLYFFAIYGEVRGMKGDPSGALVLILLFAILPVIGSFFGYHLSEFVKEFKKELSE